MVRVHAPSTELEDDMGRKWKKNKKHLWNNFICNDCTKKESFCVIFYNNDDNTLI